MRIDERFRDQIPVRVYLDRRLSIEALRNSRDNAVLNADHSKALAVMAQLCIADDNIKC